MVAAERQRHQISAIAASIRTSVSTWKCGTVAFASAIRRAIRRAKGY